MRALSQDFYERPVLDVARDLIGCTVEHGDAAGVIVETEAYHESEPACHAFVGLTPRTRTLFGAPGRAYVYRSYGIHALLNAVCEPEGVGAAVLIRALAPLAGIDAMRARRGLERGALAGSRSAAAQLEQLCSGPGKLTQALGVSLAENGGCLSSGPVRIGPRARGWRDPPLLEGTRIGISRAVELRWRFCVAGSRHVSRPWPSAAGGADAARR
ncbi:MAG: DNA-3-methyladenine glycosylase [Solirubrobacteraceae bacterium]|jgi:DNA-3-methyladenine glycosylase